MEDARGNLDALADAPQELALVRPPGEAYVPGVLLALERVASLPAGVTVGLDALL